MKRSGSADLPLHSGRVPHWLAQRMSELGREIVAAIVSDYGSAEVLARLSDPFWFQSFGAVLGMDWHSSGVTTSVMGALKRAVNPIADDLGIYICGGRGKHSRRTPQELLRHAEATGLDGDALVRASRLSAKVDNSCVQDGFQLYLHSFVVARGGEWAVVQQGMNNATGMARRYHWHSPRVRSFVSDPHAAVIGHNRGDIGNLADARAEANREGIMAFVAAPPAVQQRELRQLRMSRDHQISPRDVNARRLGAVLALAHERECADFVETLLLPGVGPRTVQSLALVSEVIHGAPHRFNDPARFAFAHGGKDGAPFPVPLKSYDESIAVLRGAVDRARIDRSEKARSLKVLHRLAERIEQQRDPFADVDRVIARERRDSHRYGGMTVKGPAQPVADDAQLPLF